MTAEEFNSKAPIGTPVIYTNDSGVKEDCKTRSRAWNFGDGTAVVMLDGKTGGDDLERITIQRDWSKKSFTPEQLTPPTEELKGY